MFPTTTGTPINPLHVAAIQRLLPGDVERSPRFSHEAVLSGGSRVRLTATEAIALEAATTQVVEALRNLSMTSTVALLS